MHIDTPDNYSAILGVPLDADNDTLKRAYRSSHAAPIPAWGEPERCLRLLFSHLACQAGSHMGHL